MKYEIVKDKLKKDGIPYFDIEIEGGYECLIKTTASKTTLKKVISLVNTDYISAIYLLMQELWITGDKEILEDSDLFLSLLDVKTSNEKSRVSTPINVDAQIADGDYVLDSLETNTPIYKIEGSYFKDVIIIEYETIIETLLKIYEITTVKEGSLISVTIDGLTCSIAKPKISDLGAVFKALEKNPLDATDMILNKFWVSGDEGLKDAKYYLSMNAVVSELLTKRSSSLKKN